MSHFSVAVFTEPNGATVEDLLAPYNENLTMESYIRHTKADIIKQGKDIQADVNSGKRRLTDYVKPIINAASDDKIFKATCEFYDYDVDDDGNVWSTYNPNSKWDWYSIGGRFSGMLKAKSGTHGEGSAFNPNPRVDGEFDSARVGDIDFSMDMEAYNKALRYWEVVVENQPLREDENKDDFFNFYRDGYYEDFYKNKETYAKICASDITYAVITPDGVWHQKGEMGWFGASSETADESLNWDLHYKERFIDTADPDWTLTIVDCHI